MILDRFRRGAVVATAAAALAAASAALALMSCSSASSSGRGGGETAAGRLAVACTISTLCSLASAVAGEFADVRTIVPVGASPETFEPSPADVVALSHARVIIENGAGLEVWLTRLLADAAPKDARRVVLADGIAAAERASGNPHLWLDPAYASIYVDEIAQALAAEDPAHADAYRKNAAAERGRLASLDVLIRSRIAAVPPERRVMICFHDAWFYFDRRYGIRDLGSIERSPGQEPSAGSFAALADLARKEHVRAIFGEPQYSPKLARALAATAGIDLVTDLYDDTLGTKPGLDSYEGMMRYDVDVIVEALKR